MIELFYACVLVIFITVALVIYVQFGILKEQKVAIARQRVIIDKQKIEIASLNTDLFLTKKRLNVSDSKLDSISETTRGK